ncbi:MAG: type I-D CRISPR-associated endonuclease Cas1d [Gloeomargarita sp. GXS_bins_116]
MTVLYITQREAVISKAYEAFEITLKQADGSWKKSTIPVQTVNQIVLFGNPRLTGDALMYALELGITVHYLSSFGKYLGSTLPSCSRNGQLRLAQYQCYQDADRCLHLVKTIVAAKITNQYTVLYRRGYRSISLKRYKSELQKQTNLEQVRGIEGTAAREYFACWPTLLGDEWGFRGRYRRPPTDPVNALLSFAYGLLRVQVTAAVHLAGLDPYIGYLHAVTRGQPALVLDLMEEFRPLVADNLVLTVLKNRELKRQDFCDSLGAYQLTEGARKTFLEAFEKKIQDEFQHSVFGYRCTYRRAIELQARLLARHLQEGVPYQPLVLR